jgi:hypothetical protein
MQYLHVQCSGPDRLSWEPAPAKGRLVAQRNGRPLAAHTSGRCDPSPRSHLQHVHASDLPAMPAPSQLVGCLGIVLAVYCLVQVTLFCHGLWYDVMTRCSGLAYDLISA